MDMAQTCVQRSEGRFQSKRGQKLPKHSQRHWGHLLCSNLLPEDFSCKFSIVVTVALSSSTTTSSLKQQHPRRKEGSCHANVQFITRG